jgi:acetoin utilization deacetylase AcuC-like enzyme
VGPIILTTDYSQDDLIEMKSDLERDMGVLKSTVDYLNEHPKADMLPLTTHPGHHAGPNQVANYCIINNSIVTAAMIKQHKPKQKIGILDLDAHPGDGTKQLVEKNEDLIDRYVSLHTDEEFSNMETFRNESKAIIFPRSQKLKGRKRNVTWNEYATKLNDCLQSLSESKLHVLIVCIGFDTLKEDPIAGLEIGFQLLPIHFKKIGAMLAQQNSQVVFIQEGGYDTNLTANAFENLVNGFRIGRKFQEISAI